jgi:hypothetical protein
MGSAKPADWKSRSTCREPAETLNAQALACSYECFACLFFWVSFEIRPINALLCGSIAISLSDFPEPVLVEDVLTTVRADVDWTLGRCKLRGIAVFYGSCV